MTRLHPRPQHEDEREPHCADPTCPRCDSPLEPGVVFGRDSSGDVEPPEHRAMVCSNEACTYAET